MKGIKYEVTGQNGNIGIITLNRPAALNAMNTETVNEMRQLLAEINEDENIRCLILTGEGRSFCAGGDINEESETCLLYTSQPPPEHWQTGLSGKAQSSLKPVP